MLFRQLVDEDLLCASYVVADGGDAVVVDAGISIERYLALARAHELTIRHVIETHVHADHVSGAQSLARATGATIHLPAGADARYAHEELAEGDAIVVGFVSLAALATPGHRPEHIALVVTDRGRSSTPCLVLTGDSLLVGDAARPDLAVADLRGAFGAARILHHSLQRLAELGPGVELWPGHLGGSLCVGKGTSERNASTIGHERAANPALAFDDASGFSDWLLHNLPVRPPSVERVVAINRGEIESEPAPALPLSPEDVVARGSKHTVVVDGRSAAAFDEMHVPRSICVEADRSGAATRARWAVASNEQVILLGETDEHAQSLAKLLRAVGFANVAGYVAGGIDAWVAAGFEVRSTRLLTVEAAAELLWSDQITLVDVRDRDEHERVHILGSVHVPWRELGTHRPALAVDKQLVVACATGRRTAIGASLLERVFDVPVARIARGGIEDLSALRVVAAAGRARA
jgi:hydroxyacylglutathione hydrolase